jgi:hypothetical protein
MTLYIAFIDLTKAFDLVSRSGLFKLLEKIGCPPHLHALVSSFHDDMHSTVTYNGSSSEPFKVSSGVKQGCVLALTLFGIFFSMLLQYAFKDCNEGVFLRTRSDGKLFNIARLRAKTKVSRVLIRECFLLTTQPSPTQLLCPTCGRDCHSKLGLHSHSRADRQKQQQNNYSKLNRKALKSTKLDKTRNNTKARNVTMIG